jgi:thiamine-phosphate pyrophosphorylase
LKGFYFITDSSLSKQGNAADVRAAEAAGVAFIQYREKNLPSKNIYEEALALRKLCRRSRFIVNDRLDIALAVKADGVHIGQDDLPLVAVRKLLGKKSIIGVTVRSIEEAVRAESEGADYCAVSPIFATGTKTDAGTPCGISLVSEIKRAVKIPVAAIGGINAGNARSVIGAGADMICAISAVVAADDVKAAIKQFQELFT